MSRVKLIKWTARTANDRSGNVSLLFALALLPIIGCIGLGIDYSIASRDQKMMQASLDSATLAAVSGNIEGNDIERVTSQQLAADFAKSNINPQFNVVVDTSHGTVSATARMSVNSLVMRVLGDSATTVSASSMAIAGAGGPMDVAIAFDTTGSMTGTKLTSAQHAAGQLVDLLFKRPGTSVPNPDMHVGLVPFTYYVNVGLQYRNASWLNVPADWTETINYSYNTYPKLPGLIHVAQTCSNDGIPYDCSYDYQNDDTSQPPTLFAGSYPVPHVWNGCIGSQTDPDDAGVAATSANPVPGFLDIGCPAPLMRLGNDPIAIKTAISGMSAGGETYIAPGLLWGWRILSADHNSPFAGDATAQAKKRLILMTDGANTHSVTTATGDHQSVDVDAANAKTALVCANIKAAGVQVYAIAFDVTDPTIKALLAQCSSGPPFYYDANTIAEMQAAFVHIGSELTAPRLMH